MKDVIQHGRADFDGTGRRRTALVALTVVLLGLLAPASLANGAVPFAVDPPSEQVPADQELVETDSDAHPTTWGISPASADGPDARPRFEYIVEPGLEYDDHVAVRNYGDEPLEVVVYAADAVAGVHGQFTLLAEDESSSMVGAWVNLGERTVSIEPRSTEVVPFTLRVPLDAEPGDWAGGVVASIRSAGTEGEISTVVENRVGSRIYVRVAGPVVPAVDVSGISATYLHQFDPTNPGSIQASAQVTNTGNVRLDIEPVLELRGPWGQELGTVAAEPILDLLPGASASLVLPIDDVWPLVRLPLTVQATPVASNGQAIDVAASAATVTVWAWPRTALGLVALAALFVVAGVLWRRRRLHATEPSPESQPAADNHVRTPIAAVSGAQERNADV